MPVSVGKLDLLETVNLLTPSGEDLQITLSYADETLIIILSFLYSDDKKKNVDFEVINSTTGKIKLTNFNNKLGTTLTKPIQIGTIGKRELFLTLLVRQVGKNEASKEVLVSFYLGNEVRNG